MANITYLFGAGASAQTLPVVKGFPDGIKAIYEELAKDEYKLSETDAFPELKWNQSKEIARQVLIQDLKWLETVARSHASVDTYAKKLFLRHNIKELNKLKAALSVYFVIAQSQSGFDKRYDSFYASILNNGFNFPTNIKILSWNYDSQFEKAFADFRQLDRRNWALKHNLGVVSKYSYDTVYKDKFILVKINGSTTISSSSVFDEFYFLENMEDGLSAEIIEQILKNYMVLAYENRNGVNSKLSFAWEDFESDDHKIVKKAISATEDTEVLIVIGYSFPFFNREVDRRIIGAMKKLRKVYFQDTKPHDVRLRFQAIRNDLVMENLVLYDEVEQFLLPMEL